MAEPKIIKDIRENKENLGDLSKLETENKDSLVDAINEVKNKEVDSSEVATKTEFENHVNDNEKHVTNDEKNSWNAKETPNGAQSKADKALNDSKIYADNKISDLNFPTNLTETELRLGNMKLTYNPDNGGSWELREV